MFRFLSFFVLLLCVILSTACSEQKRSQLPSPGREQLLQIYLLQEEAAKIPLWNNPDQKIFEEEYPARFQRAEIKGLEQAKEKLQEWNARPIDLLILASPLVQKAWTSLNLPRSSRRVVVAWSPEQESDAYLSLNFDWASIRGLLQEFCKPSCDFHPAEFAKAFDFEKFHKAGSERVISVGGRQDYLEGGRPVALKVGIKWAELFRYLMDPTRGLSQKRSFKVDFKSGLFEFVPGPGLSSPEARKGFQQILQKWSLENL